MKLGQTRVAQVFRHRIYIPFRGILAKLIDKQYSVNTEGIIELNQLGISKNVGSRYETISYSNLRRIFFVASSYNLDSFLDVGCGLGRSFVVAKQFNYKKFYGVDISPQLIKLCASNTSKLAINCNLSCCDVDEIKLPEGDLFICLIHSVAIK